MYCLSPHAHPTHYLTTPPYASPPNLTTPPLSTQSYHPAYISHLTSVLSSTYPLPALTQSTHCRGQFSPQEHSIGQTSMPSPHLPFLPPNDSSGSEQFGRPSPPSSVLPSGKDASGRSEGQRGVCSAGS